MGLTPGSIPVERNGNALQYSCLEPSVDQGAWWAASPYGQTELDTAEHACITELVMLFSVLP